MLIKIRNKFSQEAIISVDSFSLNLGMNSELQLYFTVLPDFTVKQLMTLIGLKESSFSKAWWTINPSDITHFSNYKV